MNIVPFDKLVGKHVADFLVLTATDRETAQVMKIIEPVSDDILIVNNNGNKYTIGQIGQYNIIHCQCPDMGTQEIGSSTLVTSNALKDWPCIKAVFMVGIAFGMYEDGVENLQHFSDVLVSECVFPYENQKLKAGCREYRGKEHYANKLMVSAMHAISQTWSIKNLFNEDVHIEIVKILSGEKLIDDKKERNVLKADFPEYRGGEMEGIGLAAACEQKGVPWILMKAICDFGDGNKAELKHEKQDDAARSACLALQSVLQRPDLLGELCKGEKAKFFYYGDTTLPEQVLFENYEKQNEPYYYERRVDSQILLATKIKGCWVFGESGVGKTVALIRALELISAKYFIIDLSTFVGKSLEEMFRYLYEEVCGYFEQPSDESCHTLDEIAKALGNLVEKCSDSKTFYLVIEEIPLSSEANDEGVFSDFVQQLCAMVIKIQNMRMKTTIKFVLSSIVSPVQYIRKSQQKIETLMKFISMPAWTEGECRSLFSIIQKELNYRLEDITDEDFIKQKNCSPRKIKDFLLSLKMLETKTISPVTLIEIA